MVQQNASLPYSCLDKRVTKKKCPLRRFIVTAAYRIAGAAKEHRVATVVSQVGL